MKNLIAILFLSFTISGCSLLKIASQPFKNSVSKVPEKTEKSDKNISCDGEITLDTFGNVIKCERKYKYKESNFNQQERKLGFREKIAQFILNAQGYLFWGILICIVLTFSGFGWVVSGLFNTLVGTGRVARDLVKGISSGKKYIRENGVNLSESERQMYQKALVDLLGKIDESVSSKESRKIINSLRAEVKDKV